jgi:hypothetical protein
MRLNPSVKASDRPLKAICKGAAGVLVLLVALLAAVSSAQASSDTSAGYGLSEFDASFTNADGSPATQAGSHPFAATTRLVVANHALDGEIKDLLVEQVPGFVGDTTAIPACSTEVFLSATPTEAVRCGNETQVGVTAVNFGELAGEELWYQAPVYNLQRPPGVATKLGFDVFGVFITIQVKVKAGGDYNVTASLPDVPTTIPIHRAILQLWGVPADPRHDGLRGACISGFAPSFNNFEAGGCSETVNTPERPFLTLPTRCAGPQLISYSTDSWQQPGLFVEGSIFTHNGAEPPMAQGFTGCSKLGFNPTITAQPTSRAAQSPTGLDFSLDVKDEGLTNPAGLAQSDIQKAIVTLPQGMTANPSLAEGLNVCTEEDLARETLNSTPGEGCPSESKIGTVEVETPLLEEPLKGSLFIAKPYANPFNSLLALYFVLRNPSLGIIIKQPAHVEPNPVTGQLVTTVENIPQLPFSHFKLHFREGARSPLVNPPTCGTDNVTAELTPWSGGEPVTTTSMFQIISGPNAGPCPAGGVPPFAPEATTGTLNNNAGGYSQFDLKISRKDGEQELTRFSTTFPPGLTGNLTGIPFCPDSAIEAARQKTGTQELGEPSCPAASEIGHTIVGAGVGPTLAQTPGRIYLAGPYHGAPLSIVSITSATVGPFDLGTVVIRFALRVNPTTAQVEIDSTGSDPIPHIIDGIVVNVREIHAYIDRQKFILNPTSCNPMSIQNVVTGAGADFTNPADQLPVTLTSPFQAADCANLAFKPTFKASTSGKTSKAAGASLSVKLSFPTGALGTQANISKVKVDLPKQLPSRLTTLQKACTAAQFNTNPAGCPAASVVGYAKAITPILPVPLEGPAYFVSHGGEAFPSLIMVLQGYGVTIDLVGSTFISKAGITSSTFKAVPDQPVSSFELTLPQGRYSALAANGNLCTTKLAMPTEFLAQNGAKINESTKIAITGCPKAKALTRAQKLTKALKACKKKAEAKRATCERQARKQNGPAKAKKKGKRRASNLR